MDNAIASHCQQLWWDSQSQPLTRRATLGWKQVRPAISSEGLQYSHMSRGGQPGSTRRHGSDAEWAGKSSLVDSLSQRLGNVEASPILGNVMTRVGLDESSVKRPPGQQGKWTEGILAGRPLAWTLAQLGDHLGGLVTAPGDDGLLPAPGLA